MSRPVAYRLACQPLLSLLLLLLLLHGEVSTHDGRKPAIDTMPRGLADGLFQIFLVLPYGVVKTAVS